MLINCSEEYRRFIVHYFGDHVNYLRFRWVTIKDSGNARTETESPRSETTAFQPEVNFVKIT